MEISRCPINANDQPISQLMDHWIAQSFWIKYHSISGSITERLYHLHQWFLIMNSISPLKESTQSIMRSIYSITQELTILRESTHSDIHSIRYLKDLNQIWGRFTLIHWDLEMTQLNHSIDRQWKNQYQVKGVNHSQSNETYHSKGIDSICESIELVLWDSWIPQSEII